MKYPESFQDPRRPVPLDPRSQAEMNLLHPGRQLVGDPAMWAPDVDSDESASPIVHAVELYPVPIDGRSVGYVYQKAPAGFSGENTSASPLPWIDSNAILFGALEQAFLDVEKYEQADRYKLLAADALTILHRTEDQREGAPPLRLHRSLTRHRRSRGRPGRI